MDDEQLLITIRATADMCAANLLISKTLLCAVARQSSIDRAVLRQDILDGLEFLDDSATSGAVQSCLLEFSRYAGGLLAPDQTSD
jgi:hypothetical protein